MVDGKAKHCQRPSKIAVVGNCGIKINCVEFCEGDGRVVYDVDEVVKNERTTQPGIVCGDDGQDRGSEGNQHRMMLECAKI